MQYLRSAKEFRLQEYPQGEDDHPSEHGYPGEQPQTLGQTHPPLEGELYLQHSHFACNSRAGHGEMKAPGEGEYMKERSLSETGD